MDIGLEWLLSPAERRDCGNCGGTWCGLGERERRRWVVDWRRRGRVEMNDVDEEKEECDVTSQPHLTIGVKDL